MALPVVVLVAGIAATEWRVQVDAAQRHDEAVALATNQAVQFGERLQAGLEATYYVTHVLDAFVRAHDGEVVPGDMDGFLTGLTELLPYVRSIAVAPGNRIEHIAPLTGNEAALGLYYPDNPQQWPAIQAIIASGKPTLAGPINLVQGGNGLAFRLPVTSPGQGYWGMVSTVIDSDAFLKAAAEEGIQGVPAGVRAIDVNGVAGKPFWGTEQAFDDNAVIVDVHPLGATWQAGVAAMPVSSASSNGIRLIGYSLTILVALLVFALITAVQRRRQLSMRLSRLSDRVPGMLYEMRVAPDGRSSFPYVSQGIEQMFGLSPDDVKDASGPLLSRVVAADAERIRDALGEAFESDEPWHEQLRMHDRHGAERWYLTEAVPESDADGGTLWHGFMTDVTSEMAAQDRIRVSASVYDSTHDGVVIMDPDTRISEVNPGFTALTGYTIDDVRGRTFEALGSDLTPEAVYQEMKASLARHDFWRGELVSRLHDGRVTSQSVAVSAVRGDAGTLSHFVAIVSSQNSLHDDLATGLPSRQVLADRLAQAVERARLAHGRVALITVGIDEFRDINESLGHRTGDLVLKEAAERLRAVVPEAETVARLGGDEFAILLSDHTDSASVEQIASQVVRVLAQPFILGKREVHCTGSAGISLFPEDAPDSATLLITANHAMRGAKDHGRNRHRHFTAAMQVEALERAQ
ncbi:MAG: diguanylate cyclase, partial [Actinobacteria bacterium]|nr:diguanylate cyclase [Actinomycetota bacterium]